MELLADHLSQAATGIAFPEAALPTEAGLRAFAKRTPVPAFRAAARGLLAAVQANSAWVAAARADPPPEFAPKDAAQVAEWERDLAASGKVEGPLWT